MKPGSETLLHLHIPRTAGSCVQRVLTGRLSAESQYHYTGLTSFFRRYTEAPRVMEGVQFVSGHFHYGLHEYFPSYLYFIVLRDPVERVRSLFSYIVAKPEHRLHSLISNMKFDVEKFYAEYLHLSPQFSNGQVRQLNPYHIAARVELSSQHLRDAVEVLRGDNVVVGVSDQLELGMQRIAMHMGLKLDVVPVTNTSEAASLPRIYDEVIRTHNALDYELLEVARSIAVRPNG